MELQATCVHCPIYLSLPCSWAGCTRSHALPRGAVTTVKSGCVLRMLYVFSGLIVVTSVTLYDLPQTSVCCVLDHCGVKVLLAAVVSWTVISYVTCYM